MVSKRRAKHVFVFFPGEYVLWFSIAVSISKMAGIKMTCTYTSPVRFALNGVRVTQPNYNAQVRTCQFILVNIHSLLLEVGSFSE